VNWENVEQQLKTFLDIEVSKTGFKKVVVGISGGLDSAVVSILCKKVFKDNMHGVLIPSQYSSVASINDAKELCSKFNISYETVNIASMIDGYFNNIKNEASSLRIGNLSARMRMSVLYDISARDNSLVIGTSNKSELLLGYGTIFGDIACAINPIGQMYKSDEFDFASYLGVPNSILDKKPSADLWKGQSDEEELGYTYSIMDKLLKKIIDDRISIDELKQSNEDEKLLKMLDYKIKSNAFKGKLPIIADIKF
jgi:NAD+ synthase